MKRKKIKKYLTNTEKCGIIKYTKTKGIDSMKKVAMYIAEDGTQFKDEESCVLYEREQKAKQQEIDSLLRSAMRIKEICKEHFDSMEETDDHPCASCPIWQSANKTKITLCPFMLYTDLGEVKPGDWGLE
jgi:hypothetical protein